jgi:NADH:ubiquinone oxidoreductase subunit 6 (subunit J)
MIGIAFITISVLMLAAALAAALMPKLIHAALCLVIAFGGLAAFYLLLGAEFVGLVQIFVYVGAVAVLIVFTILLTRREGESDRGFNWSGVVVAAAVLAGLVWAILRTPEVAITLPELKVLTVRQIGDTLMTDYVWPLQCVGLVLTAALIGALVLVTGQQRLDR